MYLFGDSYFKTLILKNVFNSAFIFFIVSEMLMWIFINWNSIKNTGEKKRSDKGSWLFIIIGFCSVLFINPFCRKNFLIYYLRYFSG